MPPPMRIARSGTPQARRRDVQAAAAPGYDELVLQWLMTATTLPASERAALLEHTAANRSTTQSVLYHSPTNELTADPLYQEMKTCVASLHAAGEQSLRAAYEIRQLQPTCLSMIARDVKLELCYRHQSESVFQVRSVWEELQLQQRSWSGLRVMEDATWSPTPSVAGESMCSYTAYGKDDVIYVRVHDVLSFDSSAQIRLIVRTLLFHADEVTRGCDAKWAPHFGSMITTTSK